MISIAENAGFVVRSSVGNAVTEGTSSGGSGGTGGPGSTLLFTIDQKASSFSAFFWSIIPVSGQLADFWNPAAGAPAGSPGDSRGVSGFGVNAVTPAVVVTNADSRFEVNEEFRIAFYVNATDQFLGVAPVATANFVIIDDDALAVTIAPAVLSNVEGNNTNSPFTFTITRTGDVATPLALAWSVSGTGAAPASAQDFAGGVLPTGFVTFASGETVQTITVSAAGDTRPEADESFSITLTSPTGASFVNASATGIIRNDDGAIGPNVAVTRDGVSLTEVTTTYAGPVVGLQFQYIGTDAAEAMVGTASNDFINLLAGNDAADGGLGDDVLDGGLGSNFLTGGLGRDVFFLDRRGGGETWSTIADWQAGEQLSIWGWRPGVSRFSWTERAGAPGFEGATLRGDIDGNGAIDFSVTWTGIGRTSLPAPQARDGLLWFA